MMGFAHNYTEINGEQVPLDVSLDLKKSNDSLDQSFIDFEEYPDAFLDSLLNFDDWIEDRPNSSVADVMNSEEEENPNLEKMEKSLKIKKENEEVCESEKLGDLGCLIQEGIGRVCLTSVDEVIDGDENGNVKQESQNLEVVSVKNDSEKGESADFGESEEESESSSSSSDDDDDDDDDDKGDLKKVEGGVEMEEGEIRDEIVGWSDDEDGDVIKGPIRSKNEVQDLPPVPPVNVTIQPHHQTLPVGVVLSIMGAQVIVEGVENHNPLSEGSILWITESRSPLGVVDEIFGPVKNPYYIVRYNSENEIPNGIQQGSLISFVPEFADYVLNNNNLYKKGYDASGENDEELSDELEFSDDEKEAEYKKMMKMSKRVSSEQKNGHMKKDKKSRNRGGKWKNDHQPSATPQVNGPRGFSPGPQANNFTPTSQVNEPRGFLPGQQANNFTPTSQGNGPRGFSPGQQANNFTPAPQVNRPRGFSPGPQANNFTGVWPSNGFNPSIQPQNIGFPLNGFPLNVPFMQQNFTQQPFQNVGLPNLAQFHPQFNNNGQMFPSHFVQGVAPNFGGNHPAFGSWPTAGMPLNNNFNQSQVGPPMMFQNVVPQGVVMPNGPQMENDGGGGGGVRPPFVAGNGETSQNRGGRKPFQRGGRGGGGRFRGGRSGPQSR